jgi:hypothetical protein
MTFKKGGPPGPGRPKKIIEDATQSLLLELFDDKAEAKVIKAQIREAEKGSTFAATWLWDRKYGKVKDHIDHEMIVRVVRNGNAGDTLTSFTPAAESDTD